VSALVRSIWWPGRSRRTQTPAELFALADRRRREGRAADAARLVTAGLAREPNNVTGHLLAAYLHVAARTVEPARQEFRWVLARDPAHPRALLGLARLALEENDVDACRASLTQALRFYPDFPEAQALLGALTAPRPTPSPPPAARLERLRMPPLARALVVLGADGGIIVGRPGDVKGEGERIARALGLAAATLRRAGVGTPRRGVIEDADETFFFRGDAEVTLALALPRTTHFSHGLLEVNRLWAAARHELSVRPDPAPTDAAGANEQPRRVS